VSVLADTPGERAPDGRILSAVWKLLRLRARITFSGARRAKGRARIGTVIVGLLLLAFAVFLLAMSWLLLGLLRSPDLARYLTIDTAQVVAAIPVLLLTATFVAILLTSFGGLLSALYLTGDMDFLLATPVPIRAVFVAKLTGTVAPVFGLMSLFIVPVLFGLGLSGGYSPLYYPLLLLTMAALTLAAAGLSSLLVMLVVRVMPPRRAAEILAFFGAIIAISLSQAGNVMNALRGDETSVSGSQLSGLLLGASTPWLPLNWAGRGLIELGEGRWLTGLPLVALTIGLALAVFWLAVTTAERWYYTGWAGMQVVARKSKPTRTPQAAVGTGAAPPRLARWLPQPIWGLVWRDVLTLRRDLRNLSQLVTPLILGVVYTLLLFRGGRSTPGGDVAAGDLSEPLRLLLAYSSVGMALFVGWMLLARLAGSAFSREGKSYWLVKAAPIRTGQLLTAKFLVAYLPALALSTAFTVVIAIVRQMAMAEFAYSLVASALCLAGMAGILLAFGVLSANFRWDDPRRMGGGAMGCLGQLLAMLYVPVAFGCFIGPIAVASLLRLPLLEGHLVGLALGSAVALGSAYVPLRLVRDRVAHLDETA
jgi:ABC-2 type transport system permease protein